MTEHDTIQALNEQYKIGFRLGYTAALERIFPELEKALAQIIAKAAKEAREAEK